MASSRLMRSLGKKWRWSVCFCLAACVSVVSGCGGKKESGNGKPVTGTVMFNGQPIAGATVTFSAPFTSAFGLTDDQGHFKLRTALGEQVPLGDYQVAVVKTDVPPPAPPTSAEEYRPPDPNAPPPPAPKDLLPIKYKDPNTSQLTATVSGSDKNDFEFKLTD